MADDGERQAPEGLPYGVRLTIAYDGTDFHGWQLQPGVRTVQGAIEQALARMGVTHGRVYGCSRTDAGVHAEAQVIAFAVDRLIPMKGWAMRLNSLLPRDVAVSEASPCAPDYNPRVDSLGKTYRYAMHGGQSRDPLRARRFWWLPPALARRDVDARHAQPRIEEFFDLEAMAAAAELLLGTHDFTAFRAANDGRAHTLRTMRAIRLVPGYAGYPDALAIEVEGNAFMKNMVRIFVGTLVDVGRRHTTPAEVAAMLEPGRERKDTGPTAPAHGLTLVHIELGRIAALEASHV
jgi:tRNA pseudouridine38-40 synthase